MTERPNGGTEIKIQASEDYLELDQYRESWEKGDLRFIPDDIWA